MRKRKKDPYPTFHESLKIPGGKGRCRSPMEMAIFCRLDEDSTVVRYIPEPFRVPYTYKESARSYVPDIFVEYGDGSIEVIEVKPIYQVDHPRNVAKFEAARRFCDERGYKFRIQVVRGVGFLSRHIHTIDKKYERWEDASGDWKSLLKSRDNERKGREFWEVVGGVLGWIVLIYIVVDVVRSCK
jgi:hypothetical protein